MRNALPLIFSRLTNPQYRLSWELSRLSPITKYESRGTTVASQPSADPHDEVPDHQRQQDGDDDGLAVLADQRLAPPGHLDRGLLGLGRAGHGDVDLVVFHAQLFSTVRNASWGTSTRPTCFMRFFPSF